jgi:pyridoxal phosphate enzyme (YggS family)
VAVTKAVPIDRVRQAHDLGLTDFAENRVQEAEAKVADLPQAHWQLVGHLQSNKVGRAMDLFESIQSVDSVSLAERLDRLVGASGRPSYPIYLQVNVDADPAKAGFAVAGLAEALPTLASLGHLQLRGLMTVGRLVTSAEDARATFVKLREASERLSAVEPRLGRGLSMGMSDDFEVAIDEGATVVRIGRALFGARSLAQP